MTSGTICLSISFAFCDGPRRPEAQRELRREVPLSERRHLRQVAARNDRSRSHSHKWSEPHRKRPPAQAIKSIKSSIHIIASLASLASIVTYTHTRHSRYHLIRTASQPPHDWTEIWTAKLAETSGASSLIVTSAPIGSGSARVRGRRGPYLSLPAGPPLNH